MSGTVDDEVVRMRFDTSTFARGVSSVLGLLAKLKLSLSFVGAEKGLEKVEATADKTKMSGLSSGLDGVSKKFLALATVGITALTNITNRAVNAGLTFAKSFTVAPIIDGLHEYQTNLQSIQTIQANTDQPLTKINASLQELNTYSDQTIYNFSEMAKNIGTFTAAGVDLKTATSSIKGIANLAALSGSSSEQASTAMYQLSQAISAGRVGLQDWNSVVNAGMGGKKLQTALATTAQAMGTLDKSAITTTGKMKNLTINGKSFRESITAKPGEKPWLSSEVLVNTLATLDGRFSMTALLAQKTATGQNKYTKATAAASIATARTALEQKNGVKYTDAQFASLAKLSDASFLAATQVKTLGQVFDVAKETIGSGWGASFQNIFGTFGEAKSTFTDLSNTINGIINANSLARNNILKTWHDSGGRTAGIAALTNIFKALGQIINVVRGSFREFFPRKTGEQLATMTKRFQAFTEKLKLGPETIVKLKAVFGGFFALLDIGKQIVFGIFSVFGKLFGAVGKGSGSFLSIAASVGNMVIAFDKALKSGDQIHNIFRIISNILVVPIKLFNLLGVAAHQMFANLNFGGAIDSIDKFGKTGGGTLEHLASVTSKFGDVVDGLQGKVKPAIDWLTNAFSNIGKAISTGLGSAQFANIIGGVQTGLLAGILLTVKKFMSGGLGGIHIEPTGGIFGQIRGVLDGVTKSLKTMTLQIKAKILLEIAAAIGIISLSVVALANVDAAKLAVALKAMAVGFGELLGAMAILTKISGNAGFVKIPLIAGSLILLSTAILVLTAAVTLMARLSWDELTRGLTAVGILLGIIVVATYPLSANAAGMVRAGIGIGAIAVALNLLYFAVKGFGSMNWGMMLKGLAGVGIALVGIAVIMRGMPKGMVRQAAGILLISVALDALYVAVKLFSLLNYTEMLRGLAGIAGALVAIAVGMRLMPKGMILQAAALNIIGLALLSIERAVSYMAGLSWTELAKGLSGLAGALLVLAGGLFLMEGAIGGAAALLIAAAALRIFVPVLVTMGNLSWKVIATGLGALAAAFAVIGVAGLLLSPIVPALLGLAAALGLIGLAMLAFGGGAALLGIGLTAIAASGGAAIAVIMNALKQLIALLPQAAKAIAMAVVNFVVTIGKNAPAMIGAFVTLLKGLFLAVPQVIPSLVVAINSIIVGILKVLVDNGPKIIAAGFALLMDLLRGIRDNIGQIVGTVAAIVVKFIDALAKNLGKIIASGVNLLFKFLEGVARAAGRIPGEVVKLIGIFLGALFGSFPQIVSAGIKLVGKLIGGIGSAAGKLAGAAGGLISRFTTFIGEKATSLLSAGAKIVGKVVSGIKDAVTGAASSVTQAAGSLGHSIIDGIVNGIKTFGGNIAKKLKSLAKGALDAISDFLGIGGPSMLFSDMVGSHIPEGIAHGIDKNTGVVIDSVRTMGKTSVVEMKKSIAGLSNAIANADMDTQPVITPILDLTQVRKDSAKIGGLVSVNPINAQLSYTQASDISVSRVKAAEAESADAPVNVETPAPTLNFEQNNYSPKALSPAEVYRLTNNQLSQAKKAIGVNSTPSTN